MASWTISSAQLSASALSWNCCNRNLRSSIAIRLQRPRPSLLQSSFLYIALSAFSHPGPQLSSSCFQIDWNMLAFSDSWLKLFSFLNLVTKMAPVFLKCRFYIAHYTWNLSHFLFLSSPFRSSHWRSFSFLLLHGKWSNNSNKKNCSEILLSTSKSFESQRFGFDTRVFVR